MKILFLGSSSFTGFHFVNNLSKNINHEIYCLFTKKKNAYNSIRKNRINILSKKKNLKFFYQIEFGDLKFIKLIKKEKFDALCLHHAETNNYNDDKKFNFKKSIKKNTKNINKVFRNLDKKTFILISNTIFQKIKSKKYNDINNYGRSKSITYKILKKACNKFKLKFKSIYITNPWGIYEEKKLNYYLIKCWIKGEEAIVKFPNYIRDNIFIDKLTNQYIKILYSKSNKIDYFPSGYCSTNEEFIKALKKKFEKFFNIRANVKFIYNSKHSQPKIRINSKSFKKKIKIKENLNIYFNYYKKLINKLHT